MMIKYIKIVYIVMFLLSGCSQGIYLNIIKGGSDLITEKRSYELNQIIIQNVGSPIISATKIFGYLGAYIPTKNIGHPESK